MAARQVADRTFKRSIDGFFSVFANLKNQKTGEVEKPLKNALYNVGVLILVAAVFGVFLVLLPFFRPLLWAFLVGAVLFPAKKRLSVCIKSWIDYIEREEVPIAIGLLLCPFNGLEYLGEKISLWILTHIKLLFIGLCSIISLRLIIYFVPSELFSSLISIIWWHHDFLGKIVASLNLSLVVVLVVGYAASVCLLWKSSSSNVFTIAGQGVWFLIAAYFCSYFGAFQVPALIGFLLYGLAGLLYDESSQNNLVVKLKSFVKKEEKTQETKEPQPQPPSTSSTEVFPSTPLGRLKNAKSHLTEIKQKMQLNLHHEQKQHQKSKNEVELESDTYFKILFYACTAAILWNHLWIFFLCFIPVTFYATKELCKVVGVWNYLENQWNIYRPKIIEWLEPRRNALVPICLPGVIQLNSTVHKFFCSKLKSFVDDISSVVMILILIVSVIFLSVFFFFQVYSETIAVAQLGGNLINRTLTHRPDLVEMLPINMQSMNDIIESSYKYGRETIEGYLDGVFNETNPEQASKLKVQILSVWDRLIQSYMTNVNPEGMGPRVPSESVFTTIDDIWTTSGVTFTGMFAWAKSNLGMLVEVSDSLWIVLKANLSLLFSTLTTLFSVVLGGGHAMLKFLFNTIIFFTTLYYLLQSSEDRYAPIAMNVNTNWGGRLADALEDSVSSVLVATFKLSVFHGLFTWCTHTIFGAHVVYLPAILASALAAAPFLECYWCSVPAFLDLWLSQDRFYLGLLLVLIHFIVPSNFNPIIHSEIKGGSHPYLTALAIAGGMYLFGIEGAVLGPLLLCLLVVLGTVTVNYLNSTPSTFTRQSSTEESNSIATPTTTEWEYARRTIEPINLDSTI